MFKGSIAKLSIGSLDDAKLSVEAHYNPKDLSYQRNVPWAAHALANKADADQLEVEFTGAQPRTMDLELLFDSYETHGSVQPLIDALEEMAEVRDPSSHDPAMLRPHYCVVTWGDRGVKPLRCVIESLTVRYTMLDPMGMPQRAVCNVKVRQAHLTGVFDPAERYQMTMMRRRMATRARDR